MDTLIAWITGIIAAASAIANVTPSMRDNEILAKVDDFVQKLALNLKSSDGNQNHHRWYSRATDG